MDTRFDIRLALTDRDRHGIVRLRRQGLGRYPEHNSTSDHTRIVETVDPHDADAHVFGAFDGHRAVGGLRLHILHESESPDTKALQLDRFGHYFPRQMGAVSGFVVAKHIDRDADLVAQLMRQALCVAYLHRVEFVCGAFGATWLPLLETLGWRRYLAVSACPELDGSYAMCFVLSDADHLNKVGSPIAPLAQTFGQNRFAAVYFRQLLDQHDRDGSGPKKIRSARESD